MDEYVKQSIDSRKNAIFAAYDVKGDILKKVEKLFLEMEKLGTTCKDVGEFESKLASSPLNQQYLDLFTEIATSSTAKAQASAGKTGVGKMVAGGVAAGIVESAAEDALRRVVPTRAAVNQKATDAVRGVPVLGDAIDLGQKASHAAHIGSLFKRKKKD